MTEKKFFAYLNKHWRDKGPLGSDNIQVYLQTDGYEETTGGTLHSAFVINPRMVRDVERLRVIIYNPRTDKIHISREGDHGMLTETYQGDKTEVIMELTGKLAILPPY